MPTTLHLPWPPTTNTLFTVTRNRGSQRLVMTSKGREYRAKALAAITQQKPPRYGAQRLSVTLLMHPPTNQKRDLANFEKSPIDALVFARVFTDDSQIDVLTLKRMPVVKEGRITAIITTT